MDLGEAMIVAGIGCRRGTAAAAIDAAIDAALARAGRAGATLALIATSAAKASDPGIADTAARRGIPLFLMQQSELKAAANRAETRSERVIALTGLPSLAETAALAAAGPTAKLLTPRIVVGHVTCALAEVEGAP
jgi:cobalt-precorrin 5A hydrolase